MVGGEMIYGAQVRIVMQIFFENRNRTRRRCDGGRGLEDVVTERRRAAETTTRTTTKPSSVSKYCYYDDVLICGGYSYD